MRTVVVQVERCELAVMVGFRPATGEATSATFARVASQPKSKGLETLRDVMTNTALAPVAFLVDGKPLVPTSVHAKLGLEPGGARPMVVVLVTYALPAGNRLVIRSADTKATSFSWTDRASHRIVLADAPTQGHWYNGVASMLLPLETSPGDSPCAASSLRSSRSLP
ncbi:MAG: hypothetical protein NT062_34415 [Proteobacteria bacterium]|nr:hypothetical protein [Pseudomonadota bacterium]